MKRSCCIFAGQIGVFNIIIIDMAELYAGYTVDIDIIKDREIFIYLLKWYVWYLYVSRMCSD